MVFAVACFVGAGTLLLFLAFQLGRQRPEQNEALGRMLDARLQALEAERQMWDLTREAFTNMTDRVVRPDVD